MSSSFFEVAKTDGFDIVGENIYTLSGKSVHVYSFDGALQATVVLSNLDNSSLSQADSTSRLFFAANKEKLLIGFDGKLNILDSAGPFESMYDFNVKSPGHLFANETHVIASFALGALEISAGNVSQFLDPGTPQLGFVYNDLYWHQGPGLNQYAYTTTVLTDVETDKNYLPKYFILAQNYPNPFNPSTTIKFELPQALHVKITIYNLRGQQVTTILNEMRPAGTHFVDFDGRNVANGLYYYTLSGENTFRTKKMLLLK